MGSFCLGCRFFQFFVYFDYFLLVVLSLIVNDQCNRCFEARGLQYDVLCVEWHIEHCSLAHFRGAKRFSCFKALVRFVPVIHLIAHCTSVGVCIILHSACCVDSQDQMDV